MSYTYETTNPKIVNIVAKNELIIIIVDNLDAKFSAKYVGIVKSAITKINPTAFIAATTHKAENVVKSIEIYDVQGRVIQVNKTDSKEVVLDVSTYNSGIYFVKVSTDFGSHIEKIVKD